MHVLRPARPPPTMMIFIVLGQAAAFSAAEFRERIPYLRGLTYQRFRHVSLSTGNIVSLLEKTFGKAVMVGKCIGRSLQVLYCIVAINVIVDHCRLLHKGPDEGSWCHHVTAT